MAEQILISVVAEEILKKVISLQASEEISLAWGFKGELRKLNNTFATIQEVLRDAERRKVTEGAVKLWLQRLKDVAYDADDLLDEIAYEALRYKMEIQNRMKNKVRNFFLPSNPLAFRFKMAHKIMNINGILDEIVRDKDRFQFRAENRDAVDHIPAYRNLRETDCNVNDSEIFGRENDKSKIVDMLVSSSNQENVSVLPIVGMGGLGKTTLAQLVYNDTLVEQYFDSRIWVCVSDNFDVNRLLREIIEFLENKRCDDLSRAVLVKTLQQKLSGKRFLIVLDDVWNEDDGRWFNFQSSLESIGATRGSQILVTTRSVKVATIMGTLPMHPLVGLSDDDCWQVFKRRAFWIGGATETLNLVKIGKEIVKKCKGVPLAARTLGGLMRSKKDESEWLSVRNSEILDLPQDTDGILPALKLSYDHLPSHLKQCFSYCSIFPKDYKIHKDRLIRLWMAQGYLQPSKGSKLQMEEVGDEYFNILLWNSFFQDVEKEEDEFNNDHCMSPIICKMHDLVHDLAASISGVECTVYESNKVADISEFRHLSLVSNKDILTIPLELSEAKKLRTFCSLHLSYRYRYRIESFDSMLLVTLRVLDLHKAGIEELPSSISKLRHLRYLGLSQTFIKTLPKSITSLYQLQTLTLHYCDELLELPKDMRKMICLRHLEIDGWPMNEMPTKIGQLSCLQTLPIFIVGRDSGRGINQLGCLNNLGGQLRISNLENVRNKMEATEANVKGKSNIHSLTLCWSRGQGDANSMDDVLDGLEPHPNLKTLKIEYFGGERIPTWMMTNVSGSLMLPNLIEIRFNKCHLWDHVPSLGQLPYLRVLVMEKLENVKCIGNEFYYEGSSSNSKLLFPSLKELTLSCLWNLVKWLEVPTVFPSCFPCLQNLKINNCYKLTTFPSWFPSLTDLKMYRLDELTFLPEGLLQNSKDLLQTIHIEGCHKLEAIFPGKKCQESQRETEERLQMQEVPKLTSLKSLNIKRCQSLTSVSPQVWGFISLREFEIIKCEKLACLPDGLHALKSLEKLVIRGCPNLISVPDVQDLTNLRQLEIRGCDKLWSLPEGLQCLSALKELGIGGLSKELRCFPKIEGIQHLVSLKRLTIYGWPNLTSLPEQVQHITTLSHLYICNFDGLVALPEWLGNLISLQYLKIWKCKNLMHLPTKETMRRLTTLHQLNIFCCCLLEERCANERGEEWSKISHIPYFQIKDGMGQDFSE